MSNSELKEKRHKETRLFLFQIKIQTTNYIINRDKFTQKIFSPFWHYPIEIKIGFLVVTLHIPILETARAMKL